jgi:hypothetical protein
VETGYRQACEKKRRSKQVGRGKTGGRDETDAKEGFAAGRGGEKGAECVRKVGEMRRVEREKESKADETGGRDETDEIGGVGRCDGWEW